MVGTIDAVELISLLLVSTLEATVCEELSMSLFDVASVDVTDEEEINVLLDSSLIIDGVDSRSISDTELIEVMDEVVVNLLVDAAIVDVKDVAVIKVVDSEEACSLLDNTLVDVTDGIETVDIIALLDTS